MAFGAGILISAIAFDIMDEAFATGGLAPSAGGFLLGALVFTGGSLLLARAGARHRKRSMIVENGGEDAARAIALGTAIDGIPESIVIGLSLIDGDRRGCRRGDRDLPVQYPGGAVVERRHEGRRPQRPLRLRSLGRDHGDERRVCLRRIRGLLAAFRRRSSPSPRRSPAAR